VVLGSLKRLASVLFIHADVYSTEHPMVVDETASCAERAPSVAESGTSLGMDSQRS